MLEVFTVGGGEYLVNVLNAISAWTGSGGWRSMIQVVLVIGLIYALTSVAFSLNWRILFQWFIGATLMYGVMIVPTYDVKVTDRINPSLAPATVSDVPVGLALVAHVSTLAGDYLTRTAETVFVMPANLSYSNSGIIYGARLYDRTRNFKIRDPRVRANLTKYFQQCLFYDFMLGHKNPSVVLNAPDFLAAMGPGSPARAMPYRAPDMSASIITCEQAYSNLASGDLPAEEARELQDQATAAFPGLTPGLALNQLQTDLPAVTSYFHGSGGAMDAGRVFQQRALTEAFLAARAGFGAADGDSFAALRAEEQARNTYNSIGAQAMTYVPLLHIVLVTLFFAIFPIIFPLWLIPQTGIMAMKAYMTSFFYLAAWGPLYVIIHMIAMYRAETSLSSSHPTGITPAGMAGIDAVNLETTSFAGMMLLLVPLVATAAAKGAMTMASQAQTLFGPAQGAAEAAATEQTTGNYAYGNESILNSSSFLKQANQWNTAPTQTIGHGTSTFVGADGAVTKATADGFEVVDQRPGISNIGQQLGLSQSFNDAKALQERTARSRLDQVRNALSEARSDVTRLSEEQRVGNRTENSSRSFASAGESASRGVGESGQVSLNQGATVSDSGSVTESTSDVSTNSVSLSGGSTVSSGGGGGGGAAGAGRGGRAGLPIGLSGGSSFRANRDWIDRTNNEESTRGETSNQSGARDSAERSSNTSEDFRSGVEYSSSSTGYSDNSTALSRAQERVQSLTLEESQLESQLQELSASRTITEASGISRNEDLTPIVQSRYQEKADELGITVIPFNNIARTGQQAEARALVIDKIIQDIVRERYGEVGKGLSNPEDITGNLDKPAPYDPQPIPSSLPGGFGGGGNAGARAGISGEIDAIRGEAEDRREMIQRGHGANMGQAQRRRQQARETNEE